jgi:hypothetical protein
VAEQRISMTFKQPAAKDAPARKQVDDRTNLSFQFFSAKLQTALAWPAISTAQLTIQNAFLGSRAHQKPRH